MTVVALDADGASASGTEIECLFDRFTDSRFANSGLGAFAIRRRP